MAKLGQHFLTDQGALEDIVRASGVGPGDLALEIGPGRGALTKPLLAAGAKVTAVEADDALAAALPGLLKSPNLVVHNDDFLRFDLGSLGKGPWLVVANLPYAVGTAILQKILLWENWTTATLMFQKEVAERIVSGTGGPDYGLLALSVRLRADAELALELPPSMFRPRPQVDSAVVVLRRLAKPRIEPEHEKNFWRLAKTAFTQRRKMAASVLSKSLGRPRAEVEAAFAAAGVEAGARPENIPFEAWVALARSLSPAPRS
ncbi:MAG TPA: 16S rRNA (adenine(1518)-N(6)/adenine(1519)-N(6))-dimethyltransferase RsmA [Elusimicrobiota bacterium]|nr:16S rRNA (adenine(1518)-N(6)/adenine(1519)-N(6))-dimethyltransferase RsmA [Elusimicrobiota bacterium]